MKGILPVNNITGYITNKDNSSVYLSGPPVMINSFNKSLIEKGFSENKIHFDKWE
jgi:NAD(P)H-flavin reductase